MRSNTITEKKDHIDHRDISTEEILNNKYLKVYLVEDKIDIYNDMVRVMVNKLNQNNKKGIKTSFILPVGPRGQYKRFAHICNSEKISCRDLITINMDEFLDDKSSLIPKDHPLSFRGFMDREFFSLLDNELRLKPSNIYFPDPKNLTQIEDLLKDIGGADICLGGIGINGHLAFNEPISESKISNSEFMGLKTRVLDLSRDTIVTSSFKCGGNIGLIPGKCITLGMMEIFKSKELKFYLEHGWQYTILVRSIFENSSPDCPATFIKEHKNSSITVSKNVLSISYGKYRY